MGWIIAGIMAAISAVSTALQVSASNKQAKATADAAEANYKQLVAQEEEKQDEANAKAQSEKAVRRRQAMREQAKVRVAAGESGTLGGSTSERQEIDAWQQYGFDAGIIEANRQNTINQSMYAIEAYGTSAEGTTSVAKASSYDTASALASVALASASSGTMGYSMGVS